MKRIHVWLVRAVVVAVLGVVGAPQHVAAFDKSAFIAPEGKALIVFIQNAKPDRGMTFTVFGADRRCVAEVHGRSAQVLPVEPVGHLLYVTGFGNTRRIEIYPQAGRTYFVRLHTAQKPMGRAPEVTLVRRATEGHRQLKHWLDEAIVTQSKDNDDCYGAPLKERANRTQRRINEANAGWKNADDVVRDRYTFIEVDGLTRADIELF